MHDGGKRINRIPVQQNIHLYQLRLLIIGQFIIQRSIAARCRLQAVKIIKNDLIERDMIGDHDTIRIEIIHALELPALVLRNLHYRADKIIGYDDGRLDIRFFDMLDFGLRRKFRRVAHLHHRSVRLINAINDRRRRRDQAKMILPFQPFLYDIHMQQPQKSAAKAKAQRCRGFRFENQSRIVDLHFFQRILEIVIIRAFNRIKAAIHHRRNAAIPRQRISRRMIRKRNRIADAHIAYILQGSRHESDFADIETPHVHRLRFKTADIRDLKFLAGRHHP